MNYHLFHAITENWLSKKKKTLRLFPTMYQSGHEIYPSNRSQKLVTIHTNNSCAKQENKKNPRNQTYVSFL